jgi:glycosyltransferase involved in cell wall biosynthesis
MAKKILIFSVVYPDIPGGAELAIKEITDRVNDFEFDMITLRLDSRLPSAEKVGSINVYRVGFTKKNPDTRDLIKYPLKINKYLFPVLAFFKAGKLHKKNNYQAVWGMMAAYAGFAALFFKLANPKTPFLLSLQEGDPIQYIKKKVRFVYPLFKMIFTKADYIQSISKYLADFAKEMDFRGRLEIVPNGVDIGRFTKRFPDSELNELKNELNKKDGDIFLITTSRLVCKNGLDDAIKAMAMLNDNYKFLILGTGPDDAKLRSLCQERKIANRIIFLGHKSHDDLPKHLNICDIFIRPSLSEGLGSSFLEAMAAGLPVIATPVGGIPEFLFDPEKNPDNKPTGLFVNVRDPADIAKKVKLLTNDQGLREKLIFNARQLVYEKYDWQIIGAKMEIIFNNIINKKL